jgi:hypothetical protein
MTPSDKDSCSLQKLLQNYKKMFINPIDENPIDEIWKVIEKLKIKLDKNIMHHLFSSLAEDIWFPQIIYASL